MNLKEINFTALGSIPAEDAIDMIKEAAKPRTQIAIEKPEETTHCVWFNLEQINNMVARLNLEKLFGYKTDGIRVYFGRYTERTVPKDHPEYIGRDTVLFVSTKKQVYKDEQDKEHFYHLDYFEHLIPGDPDKFMMDPENRGELCEPRSSCIGSQFEEKST